MVTLVAAGWNRRESGILMCCMCCMCMNVMVVGQA